MNGIGGIFGIYNHPEAARLTYLGLYAINHRGQDGAIIVSSDGKENYIHGGEGLVRDIFNEESLNELKGNVAVGAVYYSYMDELKEMYEKRTSPFFSIGNLEEKVFSSIGIKNNNLVCEIDPFGVFPLLIGSKDKSKIICSESCSLYIVDAKYIGNIQRGISVSIGENITHEKKKKQGNKTCMYEVIYWHRPDSILNGKSVGPIREKIGALFADEIIDGIVVPVPDSGNFFATGYSNMSKKPLRPGLIRNHYVDGNIAGTVNKGELKIKYNVSPDVVNDKNVILFDDSILAGNTLRKIIPMLKKAGTRTVNVRTGPKVVNKCPYGTNLVMEMIAEDKSDEEIRKYIGADSLKMAGLDQVKKIIGDDFCDYCMSGNKIT